MNKVSFDDLLIKSLRIRLVEERIIELYPSDVIQSPVHLSIGQEAVAVGVCEALKIEDLIFPNYRGHAFYLARGGDLKKFFAELMGRNTGISKGKAGSMHLASPEHGLMGASAVVTSSVPHAVGAALASKIKGENKRVFVAVFGDGAMEQGVFFEALNFAALHKLRVIFLCEDNNLAVHTPVNERQSFNVKSLVESFGLEYLIEIQGFDPLRVYKATVNSIEKLEKDGKSVFLHVKTMRYKEHVGPGEDFGANYRSEEEVNLWKALDPLEKSGSKFQTEIRTIKAEIDVAVEFALNSPFSYPDELLTDVI